jgi:transcriptional regulator with XRE-family HTH domain
MLNSPTKKFGEEVRHTRKRQGLSVRELAAKVGVSHAYLSQIERGKVPPPSDDILAALSTNLRCDGTRLLRLAALEKHQKGLLSLLNTTCSTEKWSNGKALLQLFQPPTELSKALLTIQSEIREGLRHGTFEFSITGDLQPNGDRRLTLKAGRVHQFTIPADEVVQ